MNKRGCYIAAYICSAVILIMCVILILYNIKNNYSFLDTSLTTILSIVTAIIISFYIVQKRNDERRKIDNIDRILLKVQTMIICSELIDASDKDAQNMALLKQKSLAVKLEYIKLNCPPNIKDDVDYICKEFTNLREFYGRHMNDNDYIVKSESEFKKYIINIDDKCDAIHINLY